MRGALKEAFKGPLWPSGRELFWFLVGAGLLAALVVVYAVFRAFARRRRVRRIEVDDRNRRQALRVPLSAEIRLLPVSGGTGCPARIIEFSASGMSLACGVELKAPADFMIDLALMGEAPLGVRWRLLRAGRAGTLGWVLHGQFVELQPDAEKTLQRWVFQREHELAHAQRLRELRPEE